MKPSCVRATPLPAPAGIRLAAVRRADPQARDRRREALGHPDHRARVGVERGVRRPAAPCASPPSSAFRPGRLLHLDLRSSAPRTTVKVSPPFGAAASSARCRASIPSTGPPPAATIRSPFRSRPEPPGCLDPRTSRPSRPAGRRPAHPPRHVRRRHGDAEERPRGSRRASRSTASRSPWPRPSATISPPSRRSALRPSRHRRRRARGPPAEPRGRVRCARSPPRPAVRAASKPRSAAAHEAEAGP